MPVRLPAEFSFATGALFHLFGILHRSSFLCLPTFAGFSFRRFGDLPLRLLLVLEALAARALERALEVIRTL